MRPVEALAADVDRAAAGLPTREPKEDEAP
jgi:hypothetical protein